MAYLSTKSILASILFSSSFYRVSLAQSVDVQPQQTYLEYATNASQTFINDYYDETTGLFAKMWWNSAVSFTELIDLQVRSPNVTKPTVPVLLSTIFDKKSQSGFLDQYYDDEGWWALNWIAAYDLTKDEDYLQEAIFIWNNIVKGWNPNCGGVWWNKSHTEENSIANLLFLAVSAGLADRQPDNQTVYLDWAQKEWSWFTTSGLLNLSPEGGIVNGAYDFTTCEATGKGGFTYIQGAAIGALIALNNVAPAPELLSNATAIADATIVYPRFTDANGIFTEPIPSNDTYTATFKGVFMYNLVTLQQHAPKQSYIDFAAKNANSIWSVARQPNGTVGYKWDSNTDPISAPSQGSAMAALLAASSLQYYYADSSSTST